MTKRNQFLKDLRKEARKAGLMVTIETKKGKGSHIIVKVGGKFTTVKDGELSPQYINLLRKQLGL